MNKLYDVQSLSFESDVMVLVVDGTCYQIPLERASNRLLQASELDRNLYKVAPSGYGIHWITLDEDLSIQGLLKVAIVPQKVA
jgi:Protein of unknown function (DUF2442)